eukprot:482438-Pyramimonas_sp.AAC.3
MRRESARREYGGGRRTLRGVGVCVQRCIRDGGVFQLGGLRCGDGIQRCECPPQRVHQGESGRTRYDANKTHMIHGCQQIGWVGVRGEKTYRNRTDMPQSPAEENVHRAPIVEGESEYTRNGHQSQKGRGNIPVAV